MPAGRPTKYNLKFCKEVDKYLKERQDEEVEVVSMRNDEKGYEKYDTKLTVKLPTIEGFSLFIGVPRRTVFDWKDEHEEFSHSLDKILVEQQRRLLDKGLSGLYNSTIAKLILSSNHGMRERTETEVNVPTGIKVDAKTQVQKIYGDGQGDREDDKDSP